MRVAVVAGAFVLAALVLAGGFLLASSMDAGASVDIEERWVSETTTSVGGNHHQPAVTTVDPTASTVDADGSNETSATVDDWHAASGTRVVVPLNGKDDDCRVVALDAVDGEPEWRHQVPQEDCHAHAVGDVAVDEFPGDEPSVLVATGTERALALDADGGDPVLRAPLADFGYSPPLVVGDALVVTDFLGTVVAVDADGEELWRHEVDASVWEQPVVAPAPDGGHRIVVSGGSTGESGVVRGLDARGDEVWTQQFDRPARSAERVSIGGEPAVVASGVDGTVAAFRASDGERHWQRTLGGTTYVAAADGALFAVDETGTVRRLATADGSVEWAWSADDEPDLAPRIGVAQLGELGTAPVVLDPSGTVRVLDPDDGSVVGTHDVDAELFAPPATSDLDGDGVDELVLVYADGRTAVLDVTVDA